MRSWPSLRTVVHRTSEDVVAATTHLLWTSVGGSHFLPRVARWALFTLGGATLESAPGGGFTFVGSPSNLTMGRDVYLNQGVFIEAIGPVTIGDGCAIGMQAMIVTSDHPIDASGAWEIDAHPLPVTIGERVWIGARAIILPGVTIGSRVVIAAGAVVAKDCLEPGVYGGVPARLLRALPREH